MEQDENIDAAAWRKLLDQQMQPLPSPLNLANLSAFARLRFQSAYKAQVTVQKLRQLTSRIQAEELLRTQHIPMTTRAVVAAGAGWHRVRCKPGKTLKSIRASMVCRLGNDHEEHLANKTVSSFYAPASLALPDVPGFCFLPDWFVLRALREVQERSRSIRLMVNRIPVNAPSWPPALVEEYEARLLAWLPAESALDASRLAILQFRREAERKSAELAVEMAAQEAQSRLLAEVRAKQAQKSAAAREKRIAQQPTKTNVNVRWRTWSKKNGRFVSVEHEASGVTVRQAGARAYIIFPNGREVAVSAKNLSISE